MFEMIPYLEFELEEAGVRVGARREGGARRETRSNDPRNWGIGTQEVTVPRGFLQYV